MNASQPSSVFSGFTQVLRTGTLVFVLILAALATMIGYQYFASAETVRAVDHTRRVLAEIYTLRTYLLNIDTAARRYAETDDRRHLDQNLVCRQGSCPSAERLLDMVRGDAAQAALETGFTAVREQAAAPLAATPLSRELAGFDHSAMEQIHRILIDAGKNTCRGAGPSDDTLRRMRIG